MRVLLLLVGLSGCTLIAQTDPAMQESSNFTLRWMEGCWVTQNGDTTERWSRVLDTHLFGTSVTISDDRVVFFEQLRIEPGSARYRYQAYPMGVGPVSFTTESSGTQEIAFINPEHDYPQRISYSLSEGVLTASTSLLDGSRSNVWKYYACDK